LRFGQPRTLEIEDALRADLYSRRDIASEPPFETLVFEGDSSPARSPMPPGRVERPVDARPS
jgi:hypothetical protein